MGDIHRADIVRVLGFPGLDIPEESVARLCGFEWARREGAVDPGGKAIEPEPIGDPQPGRVGPPVPVLPKEAYPRIRFWAAQRLERAGEAERKAGDEMPSEIATAPLPGPDQFVWTGSPLRGRPLVRWSRLWPLLRRILGDEHPGRSPDLRRVMIRIARGQPISRMPRRRRRRWHPVVHLWLDRRMGLAPFWDDYDDLLHRLSRMRGDAGLTVRALEVATQSPTGFYAAEYPIRRSGSHERILRIPSSEAKVLVLGDLGQFEPGMLSDAWLRLGASLRSREIAPWALCPCPRDRWIPGLARTWEAVAWDRGQRMTAAMRGRRACREIGENVAPARVQRAEALLRLTAPAIRIERGLLRDLRLLLPASEADVGTEYDVFRGSTGVGVTLPPEQLRSLRSHLVAMDRRQLNAVVGVLRRHHEYCAHVFGHLEVLALRDILLDGQWKGLIQDGILPALAEEEAMRFLCSTVREVAGDPEGQSELAAFAGRDFWRLQGRIQSHRVLAAVWALSVRSPHRVLPATVRPEDIAWVQDREGEVISRAVAVDKGLVLGPYTPVPLGTLATDRKTCFVKLHGDGPEFVGGVRELPWSDGVRMSPGELAGVSSITVRSEPETLTLAAMDRPYWADRIFYDQRGLGAEVDLGNERLRFRWGLSDSPTSGTRARHGGWEPEDKPKWARQVWVDSWGLAADFTVGKVPFVLRWMPPGKFWMGSPENEPGRFGDEGPRHPVTLTRGFWMAEAPVTQAQWRAVVHASGGAPPKWMMFGKGRSLAMDPSPSHFRGPEDLPVESVSWEDCTQFCRLLNGLMKDGPGFRLPTEAQWEYACRAGTQSALYNGEIQLLGGYNAPALGEIAWYGGNSGLDLEVQNPEDSSSWLEREHPHRRAGTHRVLGKPRNQWGLGDILGNVWEWCQDAWGRYSVDAVEDPRFEEDGARRVIRGGSWSGTAQYCRAAYRHPGGAGNRSLSLGFRLSAGQEPEAAVPPVAERPSGLKRRSRG